MSNLKRLRKVDGRIKGPKIAEIGQMVRPCWAALSQKVEINFQIFGPRSNPRKPIGAKLHTTKWTLVPLGCAKFHVNRCNESPLRGENADFWPISKNNTGSLPLCGILLVMSRYCVLSYKRTCLAS